MPIIIRLVRTVYAIASCRHIRASWHEYAYFTETLNIHLFTYSDYIFLFYLLISMFLVRTGLGTQTRASTLFVRNPTQRVLVASHCGTERMSIEFRRNVCAGPSLMPPRLYCRAEFKPDRALFGKNVGVPPSHKFSDINVRKHSADTCELYAILLLLSELRVETRLTAFESLMAYS